MNHTLVRRNLENSVQTFNKSKYEAQYAATGSNRWWEDRLQQEPINKAIFANMHNNKYLQVSPLKCCDMCA